MNIRRKMLRGQKSRPVTGEEGVALMDANRATKGRRMEDSFWETTRGMVREGLIVVRIWRGELAFKLDDDIEITDLSGCPVRPGDPITDEPVRYHRKLRG